MCDTMFRLDINNGIKLNNINNFCKAFIDTVYYNIKQILTVLVLPLNKQFNNCMDFCISIMYNIT